MMDVQTYENSIRVRRHWHFIEAMTVDSNRASPHQTPKIKPRARTEQEEREEKPAKQKRLRIKTQFHDVDTKLNPSHFSDPPQRLKAKQFISRIKQRQKADGKYLLSRNEQEMDEPNEFKQSNDRKRQPLKDYKRIETLSPIIQLSKQQKSTKKGKSPKLSPIIIENKPEQRIKQSTPPRKAKSFSVNLISKTPQKVHPNQKGGKPVSQKLAHQRSLSTNPEQTKSGEQLQKYLYLSVEDQRTIDQIYDKIEHLTNFESKVKLQKSRRRKLKP